MPVIPKENLIPRLRGLVAQYGYDGVAKGMGASRNSVRTWCNSPTTKLRDSTLKRIEAYIISIANQYLAPIPNNVLIANDWDTKKIVSNVTRLIDVNRGRSVEVGGSLPIFRNAAIAFTNGYQGPSGGTWRIVELHPTIERLEKYLQASAGGKQWAVEELGCSPSQIDDWLAGKIVPLPATVKRIEHFLDRVDSNKRVTSMVDRIGEKFMDESAKQEDRQLAAPMNIVVKLTTQADIRRAITVLEGMTRDDTTYVGTVTTTKGQPHLFRVGTKEYCESLVANVLDKSKDWTSAMIIETKGEESKIIWYQNACEKPFLELETMVTKKSKRRVVQMESDMVVAGDWYRVCQECGHEQKAKKPDTGKELTTSYRQAACRRCKSEALDYGKVKG